MEQLFEFASAHPVLVSSFLALFTLFIVNESRRGGSKLSPQEVVNLVNRDEALVLDVREASEFESGHIADAMNIPASELAKRMDELKGYRNKPIVLVCRMGQASGSAGLSLIKDGYEQVKRLNGGMIEWQNQNLPLVK